MVRDDGYVKVLDFGLARLSPVHGGDADAAATRLTEVGLVMGTLKYMSPEQARGETVGPPTDIYSLGMVFYELIDCGRLPACHYLTDAPATHGYPQDSRCADHTNAR